MELVCELSATNKILWDASSLDGVYLTFGRYQSNYMNLNRLSLAEMVDNIASDNIHDVKVVNGQMYIKKKKDIDEDLGIMRDIPEDEREVFKIKNRRKVKIILSLISYFASNNLDIFIDDNGRIQVDW